MSKISRHPAPQDRRRWHAAALGGAVTFSLAFALATPALAATSAPAAAPSAAQCNTQIADTTPGSVLTAGGSTARDDLAKAVAKLEAKGADVRVRVLASAPGGSLDAYEGEQVADCPSWSLDGSVKPNLIVILVSLDHQDAIFYGSNFSRLQGKVDPIRADMGGDFRDGNFAAGVTLGAQETYSALYPSGTPGWLIVVIVLGVVLVVAFALTRSRGYGGGYGGGYTYINTGGGYSGGGVSSGNGQAGGSSGSW